MPFVPAGSGRWLSVGYWNRVGYQEVDVNHPLPRAVLTREVGTGGNSRWFNV